MTELLRQRQEGVDYRVEVVTRNSSAAILAPHGGCIEPCTSEIATAIAGDSYDLYSFEGLIPRSYEVLHVTSTNYDAAACLELIGSCDRVVAVHGLNRQGTALPAGVSREDEAVLVGGLDGDLRSNLVDALTGAGFHAISVDTGPYAAIHSDNICNRGRGRAGVQLELTRPLRDGLRDDPSKLSASAVAVRAAIRSTL